MDRIVFVCRRYCPNEAWTNRLLAYAKGFMAKGARVCFIFLISDPKRSSYYIDIPDLEVINLWEDDGLLARRYRAFSYLRNLGRIKHFVQEGDVCFFTDASGIYLKQVKNSRKNIKTVFESTEHPLVLAGGKKMKEYRRLRLLKLFDTIFTISHSIRDYLVLNGISQNNIHIINMFVDTTRFKDLKKTENRKYIAYCGNVSCYKDGVDILIKAFAKFHKSHPEFKLEIYGRSVGDSITDLKHLANQYDIVNDVIFTGMIPSNEIPQKLVNANILALARPNNLQAQYGFPTKLGEYLMSGNPVVVTSVGEIPFFIKDRINGYLANPDDIDSFASKLEEALHDKSNVSVRAKELAMSDFSYLSQSEKALKIIREM